MDSRPPWLVWSTAAYRLLGRLLLPGAIVRAHCDEMAQAFGSSLRDATARGGARGFFVTWAASLVDLMTSAVHGRIELHRTRHTTTARSSHRPGLAPSRSLPGLLQDSWLDVRLACRGLLRAPLFSVTVLATLGIGIGANTATFQVISEVLRRPLRYEEPDRLVQLTLEAPALRIVGGKVSPRETQAWQESATGLQDIALLDMGLFSLGAEDRSEGEAVRGFSVSHNLFSVLGVGPSLGRAFLGEEDVPGADGVVVLSHGLWQGRYGAASDILGRTITVDARPRTVIGILPPDFEDPFGGLVASVGLYVPLAIATGSPLHSAHWLSAIGRLAPGRSVSDARGALRSRRSRLADADPTSFPTEFTVGVTDLSTATWGETTVPLRTALGATVLVLLIVCANLCGLLLARGARRGRDVAIRTAIGGSRFRVVRQALVESLVLASIGGLIGLAVAASFGSIVEAAAQVDAPRLANLRFDLAVFAFVAGVSMMSAVAFGLIPALTLSHTSPQRVLKEGEALGDSRRRRRLQDVLVVTQMAVSVLLLVGAGLLYKSFSALSSVDPGFDTESVLTFEILLPRASYPDADRVRLFHEDFGAALGRIGGIEALGAVNKRPLGTRWGCAPLLPDGRPAPQSASEYPCAEAQVATPGYFQAMGIDLVAGRTFVAGDGTADERVALVSEAVARELWPGENALGKRLRWVNESDAAAAGFEVVGVVAAVAHVGLHLPVAHAVYEPFRQAPDRRMTYALRVAGDPVTAVPAVRETLAGVDSRLQLRQLDAMEDVVAETLQVPLYASLFLAALALTGLLLSMAGVYALLANRVARQTKEIGLRVALGADAGHVVGGIVKQGVKLGLTAALFGLAGALLFGQVAAGLLFGVRPTDPQTLASVSVLVVAVAALAAYIPARVAARVDPTEALRSD